MLKKIIIVVLCSLLMQTAYSQKVFFCTKYSADGTPGDPATYWSMKQGGGVLTILYTQDKPIEDTVSILVLLRKGDTKGMYEQEAVHSMYFVKGQKFAIVEYNFNKKGKYRVRIYNEEKVLDTKDVIIAYVGEETIPTSTYRKAGLIFTARLKNNVPKDTFKTFGITVIPQGNCHRRH